MENLNFERYKEGHITPQEEEDPEKVKKGDETLQKSRSWEKFKKRVNSIAERFKKQTKENLEDVEVVEDNKTN